MIIVAIVKKYLPGNVHMDYEDGTFEWFDTTELCIEEPARIANLRLSVDHDHQLPDTSPWRKIGARLRLELEGDDIETLGIERREYFSDGIKILSYSP
ncbi:MAG: hypothetical protein Q6373_017130 [Candidatus Sigynarchaeota archaeon]